MEKRVLRVEGSRTVKYDASSEYFTLVVHHGGFIVNSPRLKYTGKKISFFDMCHVDSMSMLEIYDIVEELGYNGMYSLYWKQPAVKVSVKQLRTDSDVISMLQTMPRLKQLHVYLEEIVRETAEIDNLGAVSNKNIEIEEENVVEENEDDVVEETGDDVVEEDDDYVEDEIEQTDSDSRFENSDDAINDEAREEEVNSETLMMDLDFGNETHLNGYVSDGSDSLHSVSANESDEDDRKKHPKCPKFNAEVDMKNPRFKKGMKFSDKEILKKAIREYGIKSRHDVRFKRVDKGRIHVICKENCPWYIWASRVDPKDPMNNTWQIKSYIEEHNCVKDFRNKNVTYKWLAKKYLEQWKADPTFSIRSLRQDVQERHSYQVSLSKCLRAKNLALEIVLGNHKAQYSKIYDYLGEIKTSNPGSTTILQLENRLFQRMYICLQACKEGFKAGCRPIICLDGCHIKNYYGGYLLAAVGVDGNDSLYPICWAVVEAENESSWMWFLSLLIIDLEMTNSYHFTFMSDKQKGLIEALLELFPHSEHKKCVRHLYSNFKNVAGFKGKNLKDALWKAAKCTYKKEFDDVMAKLENLSPSAFDWLKEKDPAQWSKSHFKTLCKSDMVLNNFSECFNKLILDARDKPIITMMEMIRTDLMHKMAQKKEAADKYTGSLCLKIQRKLDLEIDHSARCWPTHAGDHIYQISCGPSNQHVVNLKKFSCTCRKWDLTGIPCSHAVSCMVRENQRPETFVHSCYKKETQQLIYSNLIKPIRGPNQWMIDTTCEPVLPPKLRRPPGRPKTKRKREADETTSNTSGRFTKRGVKMYCTKCRRPGHNQRTCKGEVGANIPIPKTRLVARNQMRPPSGRVSKLQIRRPTQTRPSTSTNQPANSQFVFIPTPGLQSENLRQQTCPTTVPMTVRWMPSGSQSFSQSSTLTQTGTQAGTQESHAQN